MVDSRQSRTQHEGTLVVIRASTVSSPYIPQAVVDLELKSVLSVDDIPTKVAVHGTTRDAWQSIRTQGLSKMNRNHIHLAQGVPGTGIISGAPLPLHITRDRI